MKISKVGNTKTWVKVTMSYFVLSQLSRKQTLKWKRSWKVLRRYIPLRSSIVQAESAEEGMRNWTFWPFFRKRASPPFILPLSQKQTKEFTLLCKQQNMSKRGWANIMVQRFFSTSLDKDVLEEGALFLLLHKRCLFRQECLEPFNRYAQNQAWNGKWKVTSLWSAIRKTPPKKLDLIRAGFSVFAIFPKIYV